MDFHKDINMPWSCHPSDQSQDQRAHIVTTRTKTLKDAFAHPIDEAQIVDIWAIKIPIKRLRR